MDRLLQQARVAPHAIAICQKDRTLDYAQLVARANGFARMLRSRGLGPADRVAVVAPKCLESLIAVIGTSLAGGVFVPCDPRMPPERLTRVLRDCDPKGLVSVPSTIDQVYQVDQGLLNSLGFIVSQGPCSLPNAIAHDFTATELDVESPAANEQRAAYILYTSGTTGEPKGVVHSHVSATSFVNWVLTTLQLNRRSVVANHAQWSFDLSVLDLWASLSCGARVELVPPEFSIRPKEFVQSLRDWHVTHFYSVPSMISLLESDGELRDRGLPDLEQLLYAGEPFAVPRLRAVMHCLPNTSVYNLFGPTETNVCLYHKVPAAPDESAHQVPIGKPCQHLTVELLDDGAHSLSPSIEGEICVAGPSVLSEYFRRPQETALAFYPAQQFADGRARYRTGDRASVDESGLYWFHGRHDRLVKRRGFRVELGEIEAAICTEPSVREAAAYVRRSEADTRIHVAVVLHATRVLSPLSLRAHCGKLLPAYMVPDVVELVSDLPRTPNGKVDLQRLSAPSAV